MCVCVCVCVCVCLCVCVCVGVGVGVGVCVYRRQTEGLTSRKHVTLLQSESLHSAFTIFRPHKSGSPEIVWRRLEAEICGQNPCEAEFTIG